MEAKKTIVLYMNDDVACGRYNNARDAYHAMQDCKESDKREHIKGNKYYFEMEYETDTNVWSVPLKITKRANKIYWRTQASKN